MKEGGTGERERERERESGDNEQHPHIMIAFILQKDQLAPNVLSMVRASNELAMMVPSEILEETTTHGRAKVISSYIKVNC